MPREIYDAVVIGGGLAGSTAGLLLRQSGWHVLILEKSKPFQDKICGEYLGPAAVPFLKALGVWEALEPETVRVHNFSVAWPQKKEISVALSSTDRGTAIPRKRLDSFLLQEAGRRGGEIRQERAQKISRTRGAFQVQTLNALGEQKFYRSRIVINASGRSGIRFPKEGPTAQADSTRFGFKAHFKNVKDQKSIRLFFFKGGYLGAVEIEEGAINLCGIAEAWRLKSKRGNFDALLGELAEENEALSLLLQGASPATPWLSCGPLPAGRRQGFRDGIFSVGDAACFVEPFLGQGMTLAIAGSFVLASTLARISTAELSKGRLNLLGAFYEKGLKKLYGTRPPRASILKAFASSPASAHLLWKLFARFPAFLQVLVRTTNRLSFPVPLPFKDSENFLEKTAPGGESPIALGLK